MKEIIEKLINIFENESNLIKDYKFKKNEVHPNNSCEMFFHWLSYKKIRICIIIAHNNLWQIIVDNHIVLDTYHLPNFFKFKKKRIYKKLIHSVCNYLHNKAERNKSEAIKETLDKLNKGKK